jgi:hypothetical protein
MGGSACAGFCFNADTDDPGPIGAMKFEDNGKGSTGFGGLGTPGVTFGQYVVLPYQFGPPLPWILGGRYTE